MKEKTSQERPLILVTNDDGIQAKGIKCLIEAVAPFGEIVIVAPDKPQSGMGHAITIHDVLRLHPSALYQKHSAYSCSGTPVDCVKLAIGEVLKRKPDVLVSGINHGANHATNVIYSGTMSAAVEGAMENIPSIGFSLMDFDLDADFTVAQWAAKKVMHEVLSNDFPKNICLNVNIPKCTREEIKGIRICRQADAFWKDTFDKRVDQFGKPYYWMKGDFAQADEREDTDVFALKNNFVSVVPTQYDLTAYQELSGISNWKF